MWGRGGLWRGYRGFEIIPVYLEGGELKILHTPEKVFSTSLPLTFFQPINSSPLFPAILTGMKRLIITLCLTIAVNSGIAESTNRKKSKAK